MLSLLAYMMERINVQAPSVAGLPNYITLSLQVGRLHGARFYARHRGQPGEDQ